MLRRDIPKLFREALRDVWGRAGDDVSFEVDSTGPTEVLATLSYDRNAAQARGGVLLSTASQHVLSVSDDLLLQDVELIGKVLRHEAIHVGYPEHDENFEKLASETNTASTERAMRGGDYVVERSENTQTFEEVYRTKNRNDALCFAREKRAGPGVYRLDY